MRAIKKGLACMLMLLLLGGCRARELEDRKFAEAMELNLWDGVLTGGFGSFLVSGETVEDIQKSYQNRLAQYLDLGHIKAIVLGRELLADGERLRCVLLELEQMPMISRNSLVFAHQYQERESYLARLAQQGEEPGEYLCDFLENHPDRSQSGTLSLGELLTRVK